MFIGEFAPFSFCFCSYSARDQKWECQSCELKEGQPAETLDDATGACKPQQMRISSVMQLITCVQSQWLDMEQHIHFLRCTLKINT